MEEYWDVADTPEQCRERRLRRIKMRRSRWCCCGHHFHRQFSSYRTNHGDRTSSTDDHEMMPPQDNNEEQMNPMPDFGKVSLIRRLSESTGLFVMEDFCRLELLGGQPMHFFAVFDAHGDPHASTLCKQLMHQFVAEELRRVCDTPAASEATVGGNLSSAILEDEDKLRDVVQTALERSFQRMVNCLSGQQSCRRCESVTDECRCEVTILNRPVAAVVAILTAQHVVIANSGTSRAVLGRAGRSRPLPHNDQPESSLDSQERLCAVDGRLVHHNCMRVYGILNMSQAHAHTSDGHLVNIFMTERDANEDECLILANEGIWNTISEDVASRVASTCLRFDQGEAATAPVNNIDGCVYGADTARDDGAEADMFFSSKSNSAAAILCRLALGRGSCGDISVMVVDLHNV